MVIDSSAIIAILSYEPDAGELAAAIQDDTIRLMSAASWLESAIVIEARHGPAGGQKFDELVQVAQIKIEPVTIEQATAAVWLFAPTAKASIRPA